MSITCVLRHFQLHSHLPESQVFAGDDGREVDEHRGRVLAGQEARSHRHLRLHVLGA